MGMNAWFGTGRAVIPHPLKQLMPVGVFVDRTQKPSIFSISCAVAMASGYTPVNKLAIQETCTFFKFARAKST